MTPRYFLRRAFALIIDFAMFAFVATLIVIAADLFTPQKKIIGPAAFWWNSCGVAELRSEEEIRALFGASDADLLPQIKCVVIRNLVHPQTVLSYGIADTKDDRVISRYVTITIDANGNRIDVYDARPFILLLFPFVTAAWLSRRGRTPGKAVVDLVVVHSLSEKPTFRAALIRDSLREMPLLLSCLYILITQAQYDGSTEAELAAGANSIDIHNLEFNIAIPVLFAVAALIWTFGSFIVWRGKTWWDSAAGTKVILRKPSD